jgi:acyl-CoA thioester hydrolase
MFCSHQIRVRYGECDQMGFVHHSVYALYFEEARTEILREFGLVYKTMEEEGIIMPVRSMNIEFKQAAKYDDLLTIKVSVVGKVEVRVRFDYEIYNQHDVLLCRATTELFFVNRMNMRPMRLPEKFQNKLP